MAHRIRFALSRLENEDKFGRIVEAGETYVGGRAKGKRGRGAANRTPVVASK